MIKKKIIYSLVIYLIIYCIFIKELLYLVIENKNLKSIEFTKNILKNGIREKNDLLNLPIISTILALISYTFANSII